LRKLEEKLGYIFQSKQNLKRALTHRSATFSGKRFDYEQLEFIGDAVLDLSVAHLLLERYPQAKEGELSKMRSSLVNTQTLASIAKELDIGPYIVLSRAEIANKASERESLLEDVVEALIGAIYREAGFGEALSVVSRLYAERLQSICTVDAKTDLQEFLHILGCSAPEYRLDGVEGPEHAPLFLSSVLIEGRPFGPGKGQTKKASQQDAARLALFTLREESASRKKNTNLKIKEAS
jgi:ribonuclease-3